MASAELIHCTPNAEEMMADIAKVSSPQNIGNGNHARLLKYCIEHGHWSVFEHAHLTVDVYTSLAIATQILRHKGFSFQQFSQRYADPTDMGFEPVQLRLQGEKNRQSSSAPLEGPQSDALMTRILHLQDVTLDLYEDMIAAGVARECARAILPQCTTTRLRITGSCRQWIHYLQVRCQPDTQLEHRQLALEIRDKIFVKNFPIVSSALGWDYVNPYLDKDIVDRMNRILADK